jgi:hypothetical protein
MQYDVYKTSEKFLLLRSPDTYFIWRDRTEILIQCYGPSENIVCKFLLVISERYINHNKHPNAADVIIQK